MQHTKTICLNMIVKNESKIITRLFDSVIDIIDTYVICDTGSTDNTKQIITDYFSNNDDPHKNRDGILFDEPFKDFGHNRTIAIERAKNMADYILLLDADMIVKIENFDSSVLDCDYYLIKQKSSAMTYYNTRLVKGNIDVNYVGPTHEFCNIKKRDKTCIKLNSIWIEDIGDGGCKSDKFQRDIKLLSNALEKEPNNERYLFYLARSYHDIGEHIKAINFYRKRISAGGWPEEVWYSYLSIGRCWLSLGKSDEFINAMHMAYFYRPSRGEPLLHLIEYYMKLNNRQLAYNYAKIGNSLPIPNDILFLDVDAHRYKIKFQYSIVAYYMGDIIGGKKACEELMKLENIPQHIADRNKDNYKFYMDK